MVSIIKLTNLSDVIFKRPKAGKYLNRVNGILLHVQLSNRSAVKTLVKNVSFSTVNFIVFLSLFAMRNSLHDENTVTI